MTIPQEYPGVGLPCAKHVLRMVPAYDRFLSISDREMGYCQGLMTL